MNRSAMHRSWSTVLSRCHASFSSGNQIQKFIQRFPKDCALQNRIICFWLFSLKCWRSVLVRLAGLSMENPWKRHWRLELPTLSSGSGKELYAVKDVRPGIGQSQRGVPQGCSRVTRYPQSGYMVTREWLLELDNCVTVHSCLASLSWSKRNPDQ